MRFKKIAVASVTALLAAGLTVGISAPANAHTHSVEATCEGLSVSLTHYAEGKPAEYKTEYQRYSWTGGILTEPPTEVPPSDNWQANTTNYKGGDPIGQPFQEGNGDNASWFYWTATEVLKSPAKANTVKIVVDGVTKVDETFDTSFTYNLTWDKTVSHTWSVKVTAWDGSNWNVDRSGTTTPCVTEPECPAYDFPKEKMWEVTWGWDFENRNGNAPKFTMTSHGGMTGLNGGPIPQYMLDYGDGDDWRWLYVTGDRTVTYQFADGTEWKVVVTGTDCTPSIVWSMTEPEPEPTPPVEEPPVEEPPTLAQTGPSEWGADLLVGGSALLLGAGLFLYDLLRRKHV